MSEPTTRRIMRLLYEHFGDDKKVGEWLLTRNPLLGGFAPWAMLVFDGRDELLQFIEHQMAGNIP